MRQMYIFIYSIQSSKLLKHSIISENYDRENDFNNCLKRKNKLKHTCKTLKIY